MPGSSVPPADPALPPRPSPARSPWAALTGWLSWFGVTRLVLAAVSVAVVAAGAFWLLRTPIPDAATGLPVAGGAGAPTTATLPPPTTSAPPSTVRDAPLLVHVAGAVLHPGVYEVPAGARVDAAVAAAGGVAPDGDADALNLAAPLADGQRVYVPLLGEVDPASVPAVAVDTSAAAAPVGGPIDLNSAAAADLEALPGVGPATATAIVDDRDRNGPFASVDDLDRVPGIGPAKLAALRDLVTV